jgi:hypothetical protein
MPGQNLLLPWNETATVSSLIALGGRLVAAAGAVQAQTVNLCSMVDTGDENVSNVAGSGSQFSCRPPPACYLPSGACAAVKTLGRQFERRLHLKWVLWTPAHQARGGHLFGRQSTVGLSGDWGAITVGRQWTMLVWSLIIPDIVGPSVYIAGLARCLHPQRTLTTRCLQANSAMSRWVPPVPVAIPSTPAHHLQA